MPEVRKKRSSQDSSELRSQAATRTKTLSDASPPRSRKRNVEARSVFLGPRVCLHQSEDCTRGTSCFLSVVAFLAFNLPHRSPLHPTLPFSALLDVVVTIAANIVIVVLSGCSGPRRTRLPTPLPFQRLGALMPVGKSEGFRFWSAD